MIARIRKFSVRNKGMEALQAVILLGAAFLIVWGLMSLYQNNEGTASDTIKDIVSGNNAKAKKG